MYNTKPRIHQYICVDACDASPPLWLGEVHASGVLTGGGACTVGRGGPPNCQTLPPVTECVKPEYHLIHVHCNPHNTNICLKE
jgi:hypothetical protein